MRLALVCLDVDVLLSRFEIVDRLLERGRIVDARGALAELREDLERRAALVMAAMREAA